ncbi:hypothetical protein QLQ12_25130 [Actinoplanes sp. NEAU-A12]|uniref:Uncharacterized protein n=1 Tax=Actinoplanes sandaracinus TaxID=3045177 RepID=A0ABT6WQ87_9ACTN|nr:hypothetical protein [Actinoplanes sandaracinus]MDI6101907.1 hypothetical protein [Actinoplanes sandaracinus]
MAEHLHPDLGAVLRQEAEQHVPDRDAMLTRIVQSRSRPARSRWALSLRPVAAAASVVATLVAGFTGIRLIGDQPEQDRTPAATEGSPSPAPAPSSSPSAGNFPSAASKTPRNDKTREPEPPAAVTTGASPNWQPVNGFLRSSAVVDSHSIGTWAQGNLTLTSTETITALEVVVNVVKTEGVKDAGKWTTVSPAMMEATVTEEKDRLVYRFRLKDGTLAAGSYIFAVQYLHAEGDRAAGADTYGALATAGGKQVPVTGVFPPK